MNRDRIREQQAAEAREREAERSRRESDVARELSSTRKRWVVAIGLAVVVAAATIAQQMVEASKSRFEQTLVSFTTHPSGAEILLRSEGNAEFRSLNRITPATLAVGNGSYAVRFEHEWCHAEERPLDLAGGTQVVEVDMRGFGNLRVDSAPKGAHVRYRKEGAATFVEHDETTPARIAELEPGIYELEVSLEGHYVVDEPTRRVNVAEGRTSAWIGRFARHGTRVGAAPRGGRTPAAPSRETNAAPVDTVPADTVLADSTPPLADPAPSDAREWAEIEERPAPRLTFEPIPARDEFGMPSEDAEPSAPPEGHLFVSLSPWVDPSDGRRYPGSLVLDGKEVLGDLEGALIPLGAGRTVSLVAENDRIFGRKQWDRLSVALRDTLRIEHAFETEELIVATRPIVSCPVYIDGRADPRRERTPYRQSVATGTHTIRIEPPNYMRVLAGEIEYVASGEVVPFAGGAGATTSLELEKGRPCRVIFVVQ